MGWRQGSVLRETDTVARRPPLLAPVSGDANVRSSVSAPSVSNVGFNLGGWVTSVCAEEKVLVWVDLATILSFPTGRD